MNDERNDKMKDEAKLADWEEQLNALLEGELDEEQTQQFKAAANKDPALARAIIESYELRQVLAAIPLQRAPASLRQKLARIPVEHRQKIRPDRFWTAWFRPAWVTALAAIPLLVIALSLRGPTEPTITEPTTAQISQAQHELAITFSYLGKVGRKTGLEIGSTMNREMQQTINQNMFRAIQDQLEFNKERSA